MMKKTLLFLMGHCVIFVSHAGNEDSNILVSSQYAVLAGITKEQNSSTQKTETNNQQTFASSPASVSFIDEMIQQSISPKKNNLVVAKHVFFRDENKFTGVQRLTIRRPISLESQASHQELHALGSLLRAHSSQFIDPKDHPTPDLGKTPEKDRHDHPTPELDKSSYNYEDDFYDQRMRSYSNASEKSSLSEDFFLGSVSIESPRISRQLFGRQRHLTPDLGSPSPIK